MTAYFHCALSAAVALLMLHHSRAVMTEAQIEPPGGPLTAEYTPARKGLVSEERCDIFFHNVTHTSFDGECKYNVTQVSCKGQCVTETIPKFYAIQGLIHTSGDLEDFYDIKCKCCGILRLSSVVRLLPMVCNNGTISKQNSTITLARECACRDCTRV